MEVVATGMGKTWLAAFDVRQFGEQLGRRPRVLVVAHRSHILVQAESALSSVLQDAFGPVTSSWYIGSQSDLAGDLVIASVQKLARREGLERLSREQFDYAIIDEVHHAHAPNYRRVMARLNCAFVLGLTATPERGDGIDVASIFDDKQCCSQFFVADRSAGQMLGARSMALTIYASASERRATDRRSDQRLFCDRPSPRSSSCSN